MKRFTACLLLLAAIVPIGAVAAHAQTTTTLSPVGPHDCGTKKVSVLFWPDGHGASAKYNFPAFPVPHVEVYKGSTTTYGDADFLAYFNNGGGNAQYTAQCTAGTVPSKLGSIASKKTTPSANALLICTFKKDALLDMTPNGTTSKMTVVASGKLEATIQLGASSGSLAYNSKDCKVKPALA